MIAMIGTEGKEGQMGIVVGDCQHLRLLLLRLHVCAFRGSTGVCYLISGVVTSHGTALRYRDS